MGIAGLFAALACAAASAATGAEPLPTPVVDCSRHIESGRGPFTPAAADLLTQRIAFSGVHLAARAPGTRFRPIGGEGWRSWKAAPLVRAGTALTLVVPQPERARLRLSWPGGSGPAVTFKPCDRRRPAFSYEGRIGQWTGFAGGFLLRSPGCRRLEVWAEGAARPVVRTIRFGVARCS